MSVIREWVRATAEKRARADNTRNNFTGLSRPQIVTNLEELVEWREHANPSGSDIARAHFDDRTRRQRSTLNALRSGRIRDLFY